MRRANLLAAARPILLLGVLVAGLHATAVLTLNPPTGAVAGSPGQTVGWGFTLSNSPDYLLVTNSAFCQGTGHTAADIGTAACSSAYASFGTYTDYIASNFSSSGIAIGPPSPDPNGGPPCTALMTTNCDTVMLTQAFDSTLMTGVGQFMINPGAMGTLSGQLLITYDLYSISPNNPNFDPGADLISTDNFFNPAASVTVTAPVPEPGTLLFMAAGFSALGFLRFRRGIRGA